MAILLDGSGGLFTRLGRIGKIALVVNTHQAALPAALESLYVQYDGLTPGTGLRDVIAEAIALRSPVVADAGRWLPILQQAGVNTLLRMVEADAPASAGSVADALAELIRQMEAGSETVERSVTTVTPTVFSGQSGNGQIVTSAVRGDGLPSELIIAENARLVCEGSSYDGTATAGVEPFRFQGELDPADPLDVWEYRWPGGSRADTSITAISPDSTENLLANSGFEIFTVANTPDQWVIQTGTAGTEVFSEAVVFFTGAMSVRIAGAATNTALTQQFGDATNGTANVPASLTPLAVSLWVRVSSVPAAGVLTVELVDGSNVVVNDNEGVANSFTVSLPGLTANTWTPQQRVFRLPKTPPAVLKLRLRLSTALSAGTNLYIDQLCLSPMAEMYPGGPFVSVFAGNVPFAFNDGWIVAATNARGGASFNATFQALFERIFGMSQLGLVLPSVTGGTETLPDTLITA